MPVAVFVHGGRPAASLIREVALLRTFHRHARANAVAYAALFVALSGTAVAAGGLARNSVGTAQLKNRAVTGRKVARKTLTASTSASARSERSRTRTASATCPRPHSKRA